MKKILSLLKSERGISLVEVVASIVITAIVLMGFSQLFIHSNKVAQNNNEKILAINLADAALVKLKAQSYINDPSIVDVNEYFTDNEESSLSKKSPPLAINVNEQLYSVTYEAFQNTTAISNASFNERDLNLIKVIVTVTAPDGKTTGSSEGYVSLE